MTSIDKRLIDGKRLLHLLECESLVNDFIENKMIPYLDGQGKEITLIASPQSHLTRPNTRGAALQGATETPNAVAPLISLEQQMERYLRELKVSLVAAISKVEYLTREIRLTKLVLKGMKEDQE